jgi:hypothetical protein
MSFIGRSHTSDEKDKREWESRDPALRPFHTYCRLPIPLFGAPSCLHLVVNRRGEGAQVQGSESTSDKKDGECARDKCARWRMRRGE